MDDLFNLQNKVDLYKQVLQNALEYRKVWEEKLKGFILMRLEEITKGVGLDSKIELKDQIRNMETIVLSLGASESGISEKINDVTEKAMIKNHGSLIYQQLFNGKVQVMILYPQIEGFGAGQPPKMIGIYRPNEIKEPFIIRHLEEFLREVTNWEDFDDDDPSTYTPIGFQMQSLAAGPEGDEQ